MKTTRLFAIVFLAMLTGCTTRITDFTIISTKNVDLSVIGHARRGTVRAQGEDVTHIIIIIPTGIPHVKEAIDKAIESVPGAVALVDGVLYYRAFYIPYIYGQKAYVVEGTPLIMPGQASSVLPTEHMVSTYDAKQKRFVTEAVSAERYAALKSKLAMVPTPQKATLQ